jgi:hypothetical protein
MGLAKIPNRNGPFAVDDDFYGSGRLDGGVRSQIRTGLRVIWQKQGDFQLKQGDQGH